MKLLLWFVVIATSSDFVKLQDNSAIENLYIDILVQRYLLLESELWNFIYTSGGKSRDVITKIRSDHRDFLTSNGLLNVMNDVYKSKFERFLNFNEFDNYVHEDASLITLLEQSHGYGTGYYATSETMLRNYNRIVSEDLFKAIKEVSVMRIENLLNKIVHFLY